MTRRETMIDLGIRAAFMVVVYLIFALQLPNYHTANGIAALLDGAALIGTASIGVGISMLAGEFDLSVGSLAALTSVIVMEIVDIGVFPSMIVGVAFAATVGALQGLVIGLLEINSLIFTIGSLIGLRGAALIISHENSVTMPIEQLPDIDFFTDHFLGVLSPLSVGMVVVFAAAGLFLRFTRWGREIYAIGGGRNEAKAAGVPLLRPMVIAFTCSGALAGLAGSVLSLRLGSATPLGFDTLLLSAATTCLMGGVALEGGRGNVIGIAIGLFTLRFLITGVASLGAPYYVQNLAAGALLIFVVIVQLLATRYRRQAARARLALRDV
jgi:ribose/xylose/arabinose/galactoside ABC-type transport system permease subunit